jgi:hypothetical protein
MTSKIFPVLLILVAVGVFFAYIHPTYTGDIKSKQEIIYQYDRALAAAKEFKETEAELLSEKNAIPPSDRARIEALLPDGVDNIQLILDLDALASRTGVRLSNYDVRQASEQESEEAALASGSAIDVGEDTPYQSITLSVTATGTYDSFRRFLDGAQKSLRLLDLTTLNIAVSNTGVYTYDMTFTIYWLD